MPPGQARLGQARLGAVAADRSPPLAAGRASAVASSSQRKLALGLRSVRRTMSKRTMRIWRLAAHCLARFALTWRAAPASTLSAARKARARAARSWNTAAFRPGVGSREAQRRWAAHAATIWSATRGCANAKRGHLPARVLRRSQRARAVSPRCAARSGSAAVRRITCASCRQQTARIAVRVWIAQLGQRATANTATRRR